MVISSCKKESIYPTLGPDETQKSIISNTNFLLKPLYRISSIENINKDLVITTPLRISNFNQKALLKPSTLIKLIRQINIDGTLNYLVVKAKTLETFIIEEQDIRIHTRKSAISESNTHFNKILKKYKLTPVKELKDKELTTSNYIKCILTIDMCTSSSNPNISWEKEDLFDFLIEFSKQEHIGVPVILFVTNKWIINNESKFEQLIKWKSEGKINITWGNHSANHRLNKDSKGKLWFLTAYNVNFKKEVLSVEELLLSYGQVPSVFFRFPGLIYNTDLLKQLNELSLIAIDSNAWINKGQPVKNGAVILIHGNGNEHEGVKKFKSQILKLQKDKLLNYSSFIEINNLN